MENRDWSENVQIHWHPAPGFFEQSAQAIAEGLQANSDSSRQAMDGWIFTSTVRRTS